MAEHAAAAMDGASGQGRPHFVLVPFLSPGHMIPMVDIAHLLAERGATVSFITTPLNAARIRATINRAEASGLPIRFAELPFPCAELGLPEGCESTDLLSSLDLVIKFLQGLSVLRAPLAAYLRQQCHPEPRPSCIISDMYHPWTRGVADEFDIPYLVFDGTCCFSLLCNRNIRQHKAYDHLDDETTPFVVPGLPHRIEITRAQAPGLFQVPALEKYASEVIEAEETSDGVVLNSFYELEPLYIDSYEKTTGKQAWAIGPVCVHGNRNLEDQDARGNNKPSVDSSSCLSWLDAWKPGSVVFVSFGSLFQITPAQIIEIGMGLEASGHPFIWVVKDNYVLSPEVEKWLLEGGFQERTKERALVIRGWAPQVAILSHPTVGCFISHCGWNSSLEAISAGLPMVTWPSFAEQFLNERLLVDVLGIGVPVGVKRRAQWKSEELRELVKREVVEEAVRKVMDGGVEGQERRERARLLGEKARKAMEMGGSSQENMTRLIRETSLLHPSKNKKSLGEERSS